MLIQNELDLSCVAITINIIATSTKKLSATLSAQHKQLHIALERLALVQFPAKSPSGSPISHSTVHRVACTKRLRVLAVTLRHHICIERDCETAPPAEMRSAQPYISHRPVARKHHNTTPSPGVRGPR